MSKQSKGIVQKDFLEAISVWVSIAGISKQNLQQPRQSLNRKFQVDMDRKSFTNKYLIFFLISSYFLRE